MGPASAKFDPEMEDEAMQNSTQTAGAFDAGNARNCAGPNAISEEREHRLVGFLQRIGGSVF